MSYINLNEVNKISEEELREIFKEHYNKGLYKVMKSIGIDKIFHKAKGTLVYDEEGKGYLDFIAGFGSLNIGHNDERILNTIIEHSNTPNFIEQSVNIYDGILANNINYLTKGELGNCHFTNSGTEAVEEAIKLSMMKNKKGKIIYFKNAYHGKTLGSLAAMGNKLKKNYNYVKGTFLEAPFGDIKKVKSLVDSYDVTSILIEPIQAEAGIILPPEGFLEELRELCNKEDILLIFDEIQTGIGRCGSMFMYEQVGVVPDVLLLAKSLSGGYIPIGCIAMKKKIWDSVYGSAKNSTLLETTFGGNSMACISALKTLEIIRDDKLSEKAKEIGDYTILKLRELMMEHHQISAIRGKGLLIGVEFEFLKKLRSKTTMEFFVGKIIGRLFKDHAILISIASNNPAVLKVEPPLTITKDEIDYFINALRETLSDDKLFSTIHAILE
ncbi:aspartate aminotransferase family protein [Clostridium sp. 'White wine YQ']|uniref:aspartate aminotransferase family protein n=1 Tax=Clostridium sp. 'White wine YQ' TaxID=3027474 RepID=UPI0023668003|nr:aspartate aminotransferase family protein [Clostridium sp. 'White wine YQ']MDD7794181.1 aspartate aminotransferase family protein [Clostridium sp. 'White wine YQ']